MRINTFEIPLYEVDVTLIQLESTDDVSTGNVLNQLLTKENVPSESIEKIFEYIDRGFHDGGDTFTCMSQRKALVLFYKITNETDYYKVYDHEKRHLTDRILEYFGIDDHESAAMLAGFLGVKFHEFQQSLNLQFDE